MQKMGWKKVMDEGLQFLKELNLCFICFFLRKQWQMGLSRVLLLIHFKLDNTHPLKKTCLTDSFIEKRKSFFLIDGKRAVVCQTYFIICFNYNFILASIKLKCFLFFIIFLLDFFLISCCLFLLSRLQRNWTTLTLTRKTLTLKARPAFRQQMTSLSPAKLHG